jgi:ssDNA-specific exonuclease RecJ
MYLLRLDHHLRYRPLILSPAFQRHSLRAPGLAFQIRNRHPQQVPNHVRSQDVVVMQTLVASKSLHSFHHCPTKDRAQQFQVASGPDSPVDVLSETWQLRNAKHPHYFVCFETKL